MWKTLKVYGIPQSSLLNNILKNLYEDSSCCVKVDSEITDFFDITTGVRQDCLLSPMLFIVTIDYIMQKTMEISGFTISWTERFKAPYQP